MEIICRSRLFRFRWCNTFWMSRWFLYYYYFSVKDLVIPPHNYFYHLKIIAILQNYSHSSFAWWSKPHTEILIWAVCLNLVCRQGRTKDLSWCHSLQWRWTCCFVFQIADGFAFTEGVLLGWLALGSRATGQFGSSGRAPNAHVELDDGV